MKREERQAALSAYYDACAAPCYRLCLLALCDWEAAAQAMLNVLIRCRRRYDRQGDIRQALLQETLRTAQAFYDPAVRTKTPAIDQLPQYFTGSEAEADALTALLTRPKAERLALCLVLLEGVSPDDAAKLLREKPETVTACLAAVDAEAMTACLQTIQPPSSLREEILPALAIGATITPNHRAQRMSLLLALGLMLLGCSVLTLFRDRFQTDFLDAAHVIGDNPDDFDTLHATLLNELSDYDYAVQTYHPTSAVLQQEPFPLFAGTGMGELYGDCYSISGGAGITTVCRYTKVATIAATGAQVPTNQEYLVWYDRQEDGVDLSPDRIYRIAASAAQFTHQELEALPALPDAVAAQQTLPDFVCTPMYVKYFAGQQWKITGAIRACGPFTLLPDGMQACLQSRLRYTQDGMQEGTLNKAQYRTELLPESESAGLLYLDETGAAMDEVREAVFGEEPLGTTSVNAYWTQCAARTRIRTVPDVRGMSQAEAVAQMTAAGIAVTAKTEASTEPAGTVLRTDPPAESTVDYGEELVTLFVSGT